MKSSLITTLSFIAVFCLSSQYAISQNPDPPPPDEIAEQKAKDEAAAKKAAENEKVNKKAIDEIDKKLKNLDKIKDADKVKALEAMKKYIQDHLKEDPTTVLDRAAKAAKKAVATGDKIGDAGSDSMVDDLKRDLAKAIFGIFVEAKGTGRTTGHIANLLVANNGSVPIVTIAQTVFIPSSGEYQPYIARIPEGVIIPSSGTVTIPLTGYCADPHVPPVSNGADFPSPDENWIPVGEPQFPSGSNDGVPVVLINTDPVSTFTPEDIPVITSTPAFTPSNNPGGDIVITWPGTDTPVGGTLNPESNPRHYAQVIVDVLERLEDAVVIIQDDELYDTPFSSDSLREQDAILQHDIWRYVGVITGDPYEEEDFAENVYNQFEANTGKPVASLTPEQKEDIDSGIADFWNVFQATGVEAKVFRDTKPEGTAIDPEQMVGDPNEPPTLISDEKSIKQCECGNISFDLLLWDTEPIPPNGWRGVQENKYQSKVKVGSKAGLPDHEIKAGKKGLKKGSAQIVELKNFDFGCSCVEITEAIGDAIKALAKLEKSNRSKLDKAKADLAKAEAALEAENKARRPNKTTIERLTGEIAKLKDKIKELEDPITAKQNEIEQLKKDATVSDCPVYESADNRIPFPAVKVTSDGKSIDGKWADEPLTWDYKFTVIKGDAAFECKIVISFYCKGDECKEVQCSRTIVIKIE